MSPPLTIPASIRTPAAQYVRMSTEEQRYSIENQKQAIRQDADQHGFEVARTYEDVGKAVSFSGQREGLRQLLKSRDYVNYGKHYCVHSRPETSLNSLSTGPMPKGIPVNETLKPLAGEKAACREIKGALSCFWNPHG